MTLRDVYRLFVEQGKSADLRGRAAVSKKLQQVKRAYSALPVAEKKFFDKERFHNPYADTRILNGQPDKKIKLILVGIDIGVQEVLMADRLCEKGAGIDLILAHHPVGEALAGLYDVMELQTELLERLGLDHAVARGLMNKRITQVRRRLHSGNHMRVVDAAKLLNIPLMCCHTASDNLVARYLQELMDKKKPKNLQQIINLLLKEKEYQQAKRGKVGPEILVGKPTDPAGKVFVDMTGGTEGSKDVFGRLSQAGVKTLLCMHLSEEHYQKVTGEYLHVVNAGHIASDNLGLNLMLDKLERRGDFKFIECSGFRRVKRSRTF